VPGLLGSKLFYGDQEDDNYELSDLVDASDPSDDEGRDDETDIDNDEVRYIFLPFSPPFSSHLTCSIAIVNLPFLFYSSVLYLRLQF
jgi:hypothetical protein